MNLTPIMTVCIPLYNGKAYILAAVESVLRQGRADVEILVSDDGSTDDSLSLLRPYVDRGQVKVYRNPTPSGMVGNWNHCASLVKTPYFTILHQDDMHAPGFLDETTAFLEREPSVGIVFPDRNTIDRHGNVVVDDKASMRKKFLSPDPTRMTEVWPSADLASRLLSGNLLCCPAAVYRTEAFSKLGPFDARFRFVQDWEYWLRACFREVTIATISRPLFLYRAHDANATVGNKKDLNKYVERKQLLDWAFHEAESRGWATAEDRRVSNRLTSKIITWDMAEDLSFNRMEDFKVKYRYGKEHVEGFGDYLPATWIHRLSVFGPKVGEIAIGFAKRILARG